jgi:hypothetical protein
VGFFFGAPMNSGFLQRSDDQNPPSGHLPGPSPGLRAWADWLIDVRKRWHESDPPPSAVRWLFRLGTGLLALAAIIEKLLGG